jgi:hypothetical protein
MSKERSKIISNQLAVNLIFVNIIVMRKLGSLFFHHIYNAANKQVALTAALQNGLA